MCSSAFDVFGVIAGAFAVLLVAMLTGLFGYAIYKIVIRPD